MKWQNKRGSSNVEDVRGRRGTGGKRPAGIKGISVGTLIIAGIVWYMGGNPMDVLVQSASAPVEQSSGTIDPNYKGTAQEEELAKIASVVLKETEDVWAKIFPKQLGKQYTPAKLVLFEQEISSACGMSTSATGPFYCPGDSKVYLDVDFYDQLKNTFGTPGDFAFAYVVAHEVGHHIQNLLGYTDYVHKQRGRISQRAYNQLSVRLELQADFLAGVWAHHSFKNTNLIEKDDFVEAINAASAIGDDNIQKKFQGKVRPETFTHGTSEQRKRWFMKGVETGDLRQGDTFNIAQL